MPDFVKQNIIQWHRDQRDRALTDKRDNDAARHARIIKELSNV